MSDDIWQFLVGVMIVAVVFMLARPGSPAAVAIKDVTTALSGLVQTATGHPIAKQDEPQINTG
jgi:hypothetical protein